MQTVAVTVQWPEHSSIPVEIHKSEFVARKISYKSIVTNNSTPISRYVSYIISAVNHLQFMNFCLDLFSCVLGLWSLRDGSCYGTRNVLYIVPSFFSFSNRSSAVLVLMVSRMTKPLTIDFEMLTSSPLAMVLPFALVLLTVLGLTYATSCIPSVYGQESGELRVNTTENIDNHIDEL